MNRPCRSSSSPTPPRHGRARRRRLTFPRANPAPPEGPPWSAPPTRQRNRSESPRIATAARVRRRHHPELRRPDTPPPHRFRPPRPPPPAHGEIPVPLCTSPSPFSHCSVLHRRRPYAGLHRRPSSHAPVVETARTGLEAVHLCCAPGLWTGPAGLRAGRLCVEAGLTTGPDRPHCRPPLLAGRPASRPNRAGDRFTVFFAVLVSLFLPR